MTKEDKIKQLVNKTLANVKNNNMQEDRKHNTEFWKNRFKSYYHAIDKEPENKKTEHIQTRAEFINELSNRLKERKNSIQQQNMKEQDTNER